VLSRAIESGDWISAEAGLQPLASSQGRAGDEAWAMVDLACRKINDASTIEKAILPWIVATEASESPKRTQLVSQLRSRFPSLDWIR
jgi:hypothetical protein